MKVLVPCKVVCERCGAVGLGEIAMRLVPGIPDTREIRHPDGWSVAGVSPRPSIVPASGRVAITLELAAGAIAGLIGRAVLAFLCSTCTTQTGVREQKSALVT